MTFLQILESFEREINLLDDEIQKPATDDSLFWLNQAVAKFTKERFNGDFVHKSSFEQNEKRRTDLIKLYKSLYYTPIEMEYHEGRTDCYDQYDIEYPSDFLYAINEDVVISNAKGENQMDTCVFECTWDSFMYRVNNNLTDFHYRFKRARPIRIRTSNGCSLLTDTKYKIYKYTLGYIRKPDEITLENPFSEYQDFEDSVLYEIIKIAAQMYLENKQSQRYQTISAEVNTQE